MHGVSFSGNADVLRRLKQVRDRMPKAVAAALYQEAQVEMTESKKRCPVDTGNLRASGHVCQPEIMGGRISVDLVYGGPAAPYALIVHENMDPNVHWNAAGTGPKYLESVLMESAPHMVNRVAARLNIPVLAT